MGGWTLTQLEKLADRKLFDFQKPLGEGLETELYYLRNVGYIDFIEQNPLGKAVHSIRAIPADGKHPDDSSQLDLRDFVRVTNNGREYLRLRRENLPRR